MVSTACPDALPRPDVKKRGKMRTTHAFSVGRHEHKMPMLTSKELQIAASGFSHETSSVTLIAYNDCRRNSETMQVLHSCQLLSGMLICRLDTHIPPREKTITRATLDRFGRLRLLINGSGSTAIATSVAIFMLALKNCEMSTMLWPALLCNFTNPDRQPIQALALESAVDNVVPEIVHRPACEYCG